MLKNQHSRPLNYKIKFGLRNKTTFLAIFAVSISKKAVKTVLLAIIVILICVLLLGVRVLFVRGGRFPSGHAAANPRLREKGIGCAHDE